MFLNKALRLGQNSIQHGFQCKTPDCKGYWINDENLNENVCPVCTALNCMQCQVMISLLFVLILIIFRGCFE